jgi:hypothetical protein
MPKNLSKNNLRLSSCLSDIFSKAGKEIPNGLMKKKRRRHSKNYPERAFKEAETGNNGCCQGFT